MNMKNLKFKTIKSILCVAFLFGVVSFGFAQSAADGDSQAYEQIDSSLSLKSARSLDTTLKIHRTDESYAAYEKYVVKKVRQIISEGNLILAREVTLVLIDNNISNFEAVDLYSYIDKAISNEVNYKNGR